MERLNIFEIVNNKFSVKKPDRKKYMKLMKSIKEYGQIKPILLNNKYEILDGHIVYSILKQLNISDVWVKIIDTNKSPEQVYLELNMLDHQLDGLESFKYMKKCNLDDNCLPYTKQELEYFISLLSFNWEDFNPEEKQVNLFEE